MGVLGSKMIKLHLGCGKRNFGKDWIHIDGGEFDHLHSHDIINLPFDNNSVDLIYACHVIEYFDRVEIVEVLNNWYTALKPEGILRIAVPDFATMAFWYINSIKGDFELDRLLGPLYGKMEMGDKSIYHKTCYDFESLYLLLSQIKFKVIRIYDWRTTEHGHFDDHSQAYIPHMDKENGKLISLNVECIK